MITLRAPGHPFHGHVIELERGRPLADTPKSWKLIGSVRQGYPHSPSIYTAKDGTLRWSQYRDGCFYAFHGKVTVPDILAKQAARDAGAWQRIMDLYRGDSTACATFTRMHIRGLFDPTGTQTY